MYESNPGPQPTSMHELPSHRLYHHRLCSCTHTMGREAAWPVRDILALARLPVPGCMVVMGVHKTCTLGAPPHLQRRRLQLRAGHADGQS